MRTMHLVVLVLSAFALAIAPVGCGDDDGGNGGNGGNGTTQVDCGSTSFSCQASCDHQREFCMDETCGGSGTGCEMTGCEEGCEQSKASASQLPEEQRKVLLGLHNCMAKNASCIGAGLCSASCVQGGG